MNRLAAHMAGIAACALLCACAATQRHAPIEQLRELRSIELAVSVPDHLSWFQDGEGQRGATPVTVPPGVSAGAAVGIGLLAHGITRGLELASTVTGRAAKVPVGRTVEDVDVPGTLLAHLQAMRSERGPALQMSAVGYPHAEGPWPATYIPAELRPFDDNDLSPSLVGRHAMASKADATLFLELRPVFWGMGGGGYTLAMDVLLVNRQGRRMLQSRHEFIGPGSDLPSEAAVGWWADQRFRRAVLQSLQALMIPVADDLWRPQEKAVDWVAMQQKVSMVPDLRIEARTSSSRCAVDSAQPAIVYRYVRNRDGLRAAAYCAHEPSARPPTGTPPEFSWTTDVMPPLRESVRAAPAAAAARP